MPILQVHEHQTIRIGENLQTNTFTEEIWQVLAWYYEKHQGKYYQLIYKGIRFKQYVGVIQTNNIVIEVLPKIDKTSQTSAWRNVLIEMLQYCRLLKIENIEKGQVQQYPNTLLDIYFDLFLKEVDLLLQRGLPQQYNLVAQNNTQWKGRLVFSKHLHHNQAHPERFYTQFQKLEQEHLFTKILYEALKMMQRLNLKETIKTKAKHIYASFPTLAPYTSWSDQDFEWLLHHPDFYQYHYLIELARLILSNSSADIRYGTHPLIAILLDMNMLFEEFIFLQLKQIANDTLKVTRQKSIPFWQRKWIRPDILLEMNKEKIIIDTKWKIPKGGQPSIEDLKQIYVYCHYFKAKKGVIIYPFAGNKENYSPPLPFLDTTQEVQCQLLFIDVLEENGKLKKHIGKDIVSAIL